MTSERWGRIKDVLAGVLEMDAPERPAALDRLCGAEPGLREEVEALLAFEAKAGTLLNTEAAPRLLPLESPPPDSIGAYRVVRELGRGGMGVVYLGQRADGQFQKQAAIKLITTGRHDARMELRFRRERQILAQLEHPGIARLLDGGATEEGQPYFIMEYIEGQCLLEYCDRQKLGVSGRLRLFLDVCDAVAYAHQKLIVHRDLKPGNILVNEQGTPQLLDFGLGHVLDAGEAAEQITQAGMPMMTPAYASPEQARGEPFTVAGDIYSLGVILYELLAGCRPYALPAGPYIEVVRVISEQEPGKLAQAGATSAETAALRSTTPDRLRRRLAGDLERIAAKALAKDPRQRYATVPEFADDLRRHLDGRPVKAHPPTLWYRAAKLLGRHRVLLPASAAALALILSFAAATWWEARRAERRFQQVRSLAHSVMFELDDAIAKLPGSTAAQALLVRRALQYLQSLARDAGNNPSLQLEVALGYERVAMVQGYVAEANLGDVPGALANFQQAENILERLALRQPNDPSVRHELSRLTNELVTQYSTAGQPEKAAGLLRESLARSQAALRDHPSDIESLRDLMATTFRVATVLTDQQKFAEAIPVSQRGVELARKLVELQPGQAETERTLALEEKKLAALLGVSKRYQESLEAYQRAREIDERLAARNPSNMRYRLDLSFDYSDLGWVTEHTGSFTDSLAWHRRALALREQAAQADPNDVRAAFAVGSSTQRIGRTQTKMGNFEEALASAQRAASLFEEIARRLKTDRMVGESLANTHWECGEALTGMAERDGVPAARRREFSARAVGEYQIALASFEGFRMKGMMPRTVEQNIQELNQAIDRARRAGDPSASWQIVPFLRPPGAAPVIRPNPSSTFRDPMSGAPVHWEALHTFNPAAIVRNGKVYVIYRAEDDSGEMRIGLHTSRLGLAESDDGIHFTRRPEPVLYPDNDSEKEREWPGGGEDPRVVESEDGTYVLTYTQWNRRKTDAAIATSRDLVHWTKQGPALGTAGKYASLSYKSAGIVTRVDRGRLIAARIKGKYWMYWGEGAVRLATSADLIHWQPVENDRGDPIAVLAPRPGHFDSSFPETGPPPVLTQQGIVFLYNGKNAAAGGDPKLGPNTYSAGEALFAADDPAKLLGRTDDPVFKPELPFEKTGQYAAGTTFAEGLVWFHNQWFLYYGCADSMVGVAARR